MTNLVINADIDLDAIKEAIENSAKLEDDRQVFKKLCEIDLVKQQLKNAMEDVERAEREVKLVINAKAKGLYGDDWRTIKGDGFKINRSFTGSVYNVVDENVDPQFIKIKVDANADAIDDYVESNNTLPDGIERNPNRGESIRITVVGHDNG